MFPNLQAEQGRNGMTNQAVADVLKLTRASYEKKKKSGNFTVSECKALCELFKTSFEYLFNEEAIIPA